MSCQELSDFAGGGCVGDSAGRLKTTGDPSAQNCDGAGKGV